MVLSEEIIYKRLRTVVSNSESIETIRRWIFHHYDKIELIVECWLNVFRAATEELRIALFYLMNDVVQTARQKEQPEFLAAFQPALISAIKVGGANDKVSSVMERVLKILAERKIYPEEIVAKLVQRLKEDDEEIIEIEPEELQTKIDKFQGAHNAFEKGCSIIKGANFHYAEMIQTKLRNRDDGKVMIGQSKAVVGKIDNFIHAAQVRQQRTTELIELIEMAQRHFTQESRDVITAADAYKQFYKSMLASQREIENMSEQNGFPGATPPRDAPSPTAQEDIYAQGVEMALSSIRGRSDNREVADMDIGDDDGGGGGFPMVMRGRQNPYPTMPPMGQTDPRMAPMLATPYQQPPAPPIAAKKEEPERLSLRNQPLNYENIRNLLEKVRQVKPSSSTDSQKPAAEAQNGQQRQVNVPERAPPAPPPKVAAPPNHPMMPPGVDSVPPPMMMDFSRPPPGFSAAPPNPYQMPPIPPPPPPSTAQSKDLDLRPPSRDKTPQQYGWPPPQPHHPPHPPPSAHQQQYSPYPPVANAPPPPPRDGYAPQNNSMNKPKPYTPMPNTYTGGPPGFGADNSRQDGYRQSRGGGDGYRGSDRGDRGHGGGYRGGRGGGYGQNRGHPYRSQQTNGGGSWNGKH